VSTSTPHGGLRCCLEVRPTVFRRPAICSGAQMATCAPAGQPARLPAVRLLVQDAAGEVDLDALRRQLAACLCGGATRISVVLAERHDVDIALLQALNGVAEYLHRRGGELTLEGVQPRVAAKITAHGLSRLVAANASRQGQLA
jgi:anti-anti-sigma regulatory factor